MTDPLPEPCLARLPPEMQRLPTHEQYVGWRTVDAVTDLDRAPSGVLDLVGESVLQRWLSNPGLLRSALERRYRRKVESSFRERDALVRYRAGDAAVRKRVGFSLSSAEETRIALLAVGAERDWAAMPPRLELPRSAETPEDPVARELAVLSDTVLREQLAEVVEGFAASYTAGRWKLLKGEWETAAFVDAQIERGRLRAHRSAEDGWRLLWCLAIFSGTVGVGLGLSWVRHRPREVSVTAHRLAFGRHAFAWTEVSRVDWTSEPVEVLAGGQSYTLGSLTLSHAARNALGRASERAKARLLELAPDDPRALEAVRKLLR